MFSKVSSDPNNVFCVIFNTDWRERPCTAVRGAFRSFPSALTGGPSSSELPGLSTVANHTRPRCAQTNQPQGASQVPPCPRKGHQGAPGRTAGGLWPGKRFRAPVAGKGMREKHLQGQPRRKGVPRLVSKWGRGDQTRQQGFPNGGVTHGRAREVCPKEGIASVSCEGCAVAKRSQEGLGGATSPDRECPGPLAARRLAP